MAAITEKSKTNKIAIFTKTARYIGGNFIWSISRTLMLIDIKMKKSVVELGHNDCLKIYVDPKFYVDPGILVHFSKMALYIWLKFCLVYKWDLGVD